MLTRRCASALTVAFGLSVIGGTADAAIMLATWTTTISDYRDAEKFAPPPNIIGTTIQFRIKYDTSLGDLYGDKLNDYVFVELLSGTTQPLLAFDVTYGGATYDLFAPDAALTQNQKQIYNGGSTASSRVTSQLTVNGVRYQHDLQISGLAGPGDIPFSIDTPYSTSFEGLGTYRFGPAGENGVEIVATSTAGAPGRLDVVRLDVPTAPLPEPATWAMMIVGFGLVGCAARSRTAQTA